MQLEKNQGDFTHIQVQACLPEWPEDDPRWCEHARRVTGRGRLLVSEGLLQLCLLQTPPFRGAGDITIDSNEIYDVQERGKRYACEDRPRLLATMATALFEYECMLRALQGPSLSLQQRLHRQLLNIALFVDYFMWHWSHEKLPVHTPLRHKRETITKAFEQIRHVIDVMSPADFARMWSPRGHPRRMLLQEMQQAFAQYGPRQYPTTAVFRAIAAILLQLGIERGRDAGKGDIDNEVVHTVAERLYKFMQRGHDKQFFERWDTFLADLKPYEP